MHVVASLENEAAGTTICVQRLAEEMARAKAEVRIATVGNAEAMRDKDFVLHNCDLDWARTPVLSRLLVSKALRRRLVEQASATDIFHNHGLWRMPNIYPGQVAAGRRPLLVVSPHGMLGPGALAFSRRAKDFFWRYAQKSALKQAAFWHATSKKELDDIRAFGIDAPIALVPNGVDLPATWGHLPQGPAGRKRLLFLGRLHPKKGLDSLLRVWCRIAPDFEDWDFAIVGPIEDQYAREYRSKVEQSAMPRIIFEGPRYGAEKLTEYRAASLLVLPTLDENFGMTVAESLAAGMPVICSKGAPWAGLLEHDCGWWIDHGDEALEHHLRNAMATTPSHLAEMGARGRAWMDRDFSWRTMAERLLEAYLWAVGVGARPSFVDRGRTGC